MWLFFSLLDTILCKKKKEEQNSRLRKVPQTHKDFAKPPASNMVTTKTGQHFFSCRNELENCQVWLTFCLDSQGNVLHHNQRSKMVNLVSIFPSPCSVSQTVHVASCHLRRGGDADLCAIGRQEKVVGLSEGPGSLNASSSFPVFSFVF